MGRQLVVVEGPDQDKIFPLDSNTPYLLGRAEECTIRLRDASVSRKHCQLLFEADQLRITDLGSTSGTYVNGDRIADGILRVGDMINLGTSLLRIEPTPGDPECESSDFGSYTANLSTVGRKPSTIPKDLVFGPELSLFHIDRPISETETGILFLAHHKETNILVSLKMFSRDFCQNEEQMQRFLRAIRTMLPLKNEHLVTLYSAGINDSVGWVALEYVPGPSLAQFVERQTKAERLTWPQAHRLMTQLALALEAAAQYHVLHRNLHPEKVYLREPDGLVKLGGLLLAKSLEGQLAERITRPGRLVGDMVYMSPEQTRSVTALDHRTDIYSLGATIYFALCGRPPFVGGTVPDLANRIRQAQPEMLRKYQPNIIPEFEALVLRCLAKQPDDRPQSATHLLQELALIGRNHPLGDTTIPLTPGQYQQEIQDPL